MALILPDRSGRRRQRLQYFRMCGCTMRPSRIHLITKTISHRVMRWQRAWAHTYTIIDTRRQRYTDTSTCKHIHKEAQVHKQKKSNREKERARTGERRNQIDKQQLTCTTKMTMPMVPSMCLLSSSHSSTFSKQPCEGQQQLVKV